MQDKRRHHRVAFVTEITCIPDGGQSFRAYAADISLGGMFVTSSESPAFGTHMVVAITLPGQPKPFDLPCIVRWSKADGFGVQFGLLGARETHAITRLI